MQTHELKTLPRYFAASELGEKMFEVRNNSDRGFQRGDMVILREHTPGIGYTSRKLQRRITYVTNFGQKEGWVVFGVSDKSE